MGYQVYTGANKASLVVDAHAAEVGGATSRVCVGDKLCFMLAGQLSSIQPLQ